MTERPTVDMVIRLNESECALTGERSRLRDRTQLEAAVERPWSGFGDHEAFSTLYEKAAALLHGIASTQAFENGNKRTAWLAGVGLLDINGIDLGRVEPIQSEAVVRAAATDHTFGVEGVAEWLEITHRLRRVGYATDSRLEYAYLARAAESTDDQTMSVLGAHSHGIVVEHLPRAASLGFVSRVHWNAEDMDLQHDLTVSVVGPDGTEHAVAQVTDTPAAAGGHSHHAGGRIPALVSVPLLLVFQQAGRYTFRAQLDDIEVASMPFDVVHSPPPSI